MSFMEVSEIHENSERLRKINAYLLEQLNKSRLTIGKNILYVCFIKLSLFLCSQARFFCSVMLQRRV